VLKKERIDALFCILKSVETNTILGKRNELAQMVAASFLFFLTMVRLISIKNKKIKRTAGRSS
jgi:hypothetical protein